MKITKQKAIELISQVTVAKVQKIFKHENADKLFITKLEVGDINIPAQLKDSEGLIQVVTGASNVSEGDFVPYLPPGKSVPGWIIQKGEEIILESRPMRGEISHGMILAADEIGIGDDHEGIYILKQVDESAIGKGLDQVLDEKILSSITGEFIINITPEVQEKIDLITRDLAEFVGEGEMAEILSERSLKIYWGTAPTGKPSIGYFVPMMKIADFLKAGCEVTILFANIHAFLDNLKSTWELLEHRTEYYKLVITEILKTVGAPIEKLRFVTGSEFQLDSKYTMDMYKIASITTIQSVKGAGAEVVKQVENPLLSGMLYPILQALDEHYLEADAQLGGIDQRKIFMFAREYLPKIGYKKRIHLMNKLIPGLGKSGKMSSSEPNSKIDLDEAEESIKDKISKAYSVDKIVEGNGLLALCNYILFRRFETEGKGIKITREEKWGGDIEYKTYKDLEKDFVNGKLSSVDLKPAVANEIIELLKPIKQVIEINRVLVEKAYPIDK
jgi:tyrosyl-tRNA synthetase